MKLGQLSQATLNTIPHGRRATVVEVIVSGIRSLRLMEMGLVPGASVAVVRSAPLGDPLHIRLRDYHLALRRVEAETIGVVLCDEE